MSQAIAVVAILDAKPESVAQLEAAIGPCVKETQLEPGCKLYKCHRDLNVAGRFVFIEEWESLDALAQHKKTAHLLALVEASKTLLATPMQVSVLAPL